MKLKVLFLATVILAINAKEWLDQPDWMKVYPHGEWSEWGPCDNDGFHTSVRVDCERENQNCILRFRNEYCNGQQGKSFDYWGSPQSICPSSGILERRQKCWRGPCTGEYRQLRACIPTNSDK
ncbi:uncharacterized protein LOC135493827 [Lineus longissimus]|uniref:uncharacterized protein LOC135493827 n=1 Tax=Lineus longissimus TaxID=88925 RepID=UPI002B4C50FF